MASRCLGRRTNERLLFGDGKHYFYTEERCKKMSETKLCKTCTGSKNLGEHGLISETIPPLSHIYESAWYDLKRTVYGDPSKEDMEKAKKAKEEARTDVVAAVSATTVSAAPVSAAPVSATPVSATSVKKRTFKVAAPTVPVPTQAPVLSQAPVKAKRQPKKVVQVQAAVLAVNPLATESTEPPLQDLPCITISVRKIEHAGRKYYLNSDKDKLYTVMPDGGVGKYCGRLDREKERIADFPDSDSER